jgi:hypothetical protein
VSLRIGRLETHCRPPRGQEELCGLVDEVARGSLPRALGERLGPSLDREAAVVRLRRVEVTLKIDAAALRKGGLEAAWAAALAAALHAALARPEGDGDRVRRFDTPESYRAAMIVAILAGERGAAWQFPELAAHAGQPAAVAVLAVLLRAGPKLGEVLARLLALGKLDHALAGLDEVGLERLMRTAAETANAALTTAQFVRVATMLAGQGAPPRRGDAAGRRQAIGLWLALERTLPLRGVWNALRLLLRLLEAPSLLAGEAAGPVAALPDWCEAVRRDLARALPAPAAASLERLRQITPSAAPARPKRAERWVESDCAGVLLLCDTLRRLGWTKTWRAAGLGPEQAQAWLAGIGMRAVARDAAPARWRPGESIDPAVALFAGIWGEPSRIGIARIYAAAPPAGLPVFAPRADWDAALDAAAVQLASGFAGRIRGFRHAAPGAVASHFLRRPGRILVEDGALRVVLNPSPYAIILHVSGVDAAAENLDWLVGRRVSFVLEGL